MFPISTALAVEFPTLLAPCCLLQEQRGRKAYSSQGSHGAKSPKYFSCRTPLNPLHNIKMSFVICPTQKPASLSKIIPPFPLQKCFRNSATGLPLPNSKQAEKKKSFSMKIKLQSSGVSLPV